MVIARFAKIWYSKKDISDFTADVQCKAERVSGSVHLPLLIITRKQPDVNFNILSSLLVMFNSVRSCFTEFCMLAWVVCYTYHRRTAAVFSLFLPCRRKRRLFFYGKLCKVTNRTTNKN